MPVHCREADLRTEAQTAIGTTAVTAGAVVLGLEDDPTVKKFFANMPATGFAVVLPAENGPWNGQTRHFDIIIKILLYFGATANNSVDFIAFEDIWTAVRNALINTTSWQRSPPDEFEISGPDPRTDLKPTDVFMYSIKLIFPAGAGTS